MSTHNPNTVGIQTKQLGGSFSEIAAIANFQDREDVELVPFSNHKEAVRGFITRKANELFIPVENSTSGRVIEWVEAFDNTSLGKHAVIAGAYVLKVEQCLLAVDGMSEGDIQAVCSMRPALDQTRVYSSGRNLIEIEDADTLGAAIRVKEQGGLINDLKTAAVASSLAGETAGLINLRTINDEPSNATRFWHIVHADLRILSGSNVAVTFNVPETRQGLLGAMRVFKEHGYQEIDVDSHLRSKSSLRHSFYGEFLRPHDTADPKKLIAELEKAGVTSKILGIYSPKDGRGDVTINTAPNKINDPIMLNLRSLNVEEGATVLYIDAEALIDILECLKITNIHDMCRPKIPTGKNFTRGYYVSLVGVPNSLIYNALRRLEAKQLITTRYSIKNGKMHA